MWRIENEKGESITGKDMWWHEVPEDFKIAKFIIILPNDEIITLTNHSKYGYQKFKSVTIQGKGSTGEQFIMVDSNDIVKRFEVVPGDVSMHIKALKPIKLNELTYRKDYLRSGV